jgi:two-component system sensor histidine kinase PilS (NtrC family)
VTPRARLLTLVAVRVLVSTVLLGSAMLVELNRPGTFPVRASFAIIGLAYASSLAVLVSLRMVDRWRWLVDAQFFIDAVLVSAFILITGGVTSYFSSLYVLPIIAAATIRSRRGALQVAGVSAAVYLAMAAFQYGSTPVWSPPDWLAAGLPSDRFALFTAAINVLGFVAVALLSGSLAESLRSAGARLEHASHQMADLRAFNEYVIDNLLSGLATADEAGSLLTFNRAAATITGVDADQAVGQRAAEVLQLPAGVQARLEGLDATRGLRVELPYRGPDGRVIDVGMTVSALVFPDGRTGALYTFQDVTDVRRLERNARLQQRLAAVGEMAAGIAHEIRNPLASMSGSLQVLRQELALSEEQGQLMDIVLKESDRLNHTIRSFLAYARPRKSAIGRLDLCRIVADTALLLRNGADVRANHDVDIDVPEAPVWYEADENQIRQIVWNLATNGLRAMADGGRLQLMVRREIGGDAGVDEAVITVEDTGCGIPADELDGIFEPFRSSFARGTGLGLAIVHRSVTDYGGTIHVSSTVGEGTTVRVRLPQPARIQAGGAPVVASGGAA